MKLNLNDAPSGLLRRRRRRRAQKALARMLEFQKAKAQRFVEESRDPSEGMKQHSALVREMLEKTHGIKSDARVLEVGSGAHGLIFFFGARRAIGIDPLAHHYVKLFPAWQCRVMTVSAEGERLPFPDNSFDAVLSDDVVDYAEDPERIVSEIARVLAPGGLVYLSVNICHPIWRAISLVYDPADFHTTFISLSRARGFLQRLPLRLVWENENISETTAAVSQRKKHRIRARFKALCYYKARYTAIAVRDVV